MVENVPDKKNNIHKCYQPEWNSFRLFGNMGALSVIYEESFDLLLSYGRKFYREEVLIEDAFQNIFKKLIRQRERLGEINHISKYLMIVLRNEILNLIRKSTIVIENIPDIMFKPEYSIEEETVEKQGQSRLNKFLNISLYKLTSHQQEILYLKYDVDLSYQDISKTFNISVQSCRTAVYRAAKQIKADLDPLKKGNIYIFLMTIGKLFGSKLD